MAFNLDNLKNILATWRQKLEALKNSDAKIFSLDRLKDIDLKVKVHKATDIIKGIDWQKLKNLDIKEIIQKLRTLDVSSIKLPFMAHKVASITTIGMVGIYFAKTKLYLAYLACDPKSVAAANANLPQNSIDKTYNFIDATEGTAAEEKFKPKIICFAARDASSWEERTKALTELVAEYKLHKQICNVVSAVGEFKISMVDRPDVSEDSVIDAVPGLIKDYLNYPVEDASLAFFPLPFPKNSNNKKVIFAVAMNLALMRQIEACVLGAGMQLESIDIPELCLCRLSFLADAEVTNYMFIEINEKTTNLFVYYNHDLVVSKGINSDLSGFSLNKEIFLNPEAEYDALNELGGDIQRYMEYCNTVFRQEPVKRIYFSSNSVNIDLISSYLGQRLSLDTKVIDLKDIFSVPDNYTAASGREFILPISAGLREIGMVANAKN